MLETRYHLVAKALHWLVALLVAVQFGICRGDAGYMAKLKAPNNNKLPDFCCPTIRLQDNHIWQERMLCLKETV